MKVRNTEPGGWYFEFNNEFYPDTDDTAQVLLALSKVDNPRERYQHQVAERAIAWEFAMQCRNGGWGSFDKDNTKMIFQYIPFADHNAMLDPPTVDITGRMLEMLAVYGYTRQDKRVQRAIEFIFREQEPDGSWFGRWGVNYIYGTFLVLRGLDAIGVDHLEPQVQQAAEWIRMVQNADGGWGESCRHLRRARHARHRHEHSLADCLGADGSACRRRRPLRLHRQRRALAARAADAKTEVGTSPWARDARARPSLPAPDSPRFSIWPTPCIASTSR